MVRQIGMTISTAFVSAFPLPLRSTAPRKCPLTPRISVSMRVVGDPEVPQDDTQGKDTEPQVVGSVVPAADFEDNDIKHGTESKADAEGVAGIADDEDLLLEEKPTINGFVTDVESDSTEIESASKTEARKENIEKVSSSAKADGATKEKETVVETVNEVKKSDEPVKQDISPPKTSLKMTPEQIEKAKAAREAAIKAAEDRDAKKTEQGKEVVAKAEEILIKLGTKSKAFELGESARAKAEKFVENTISAGKEKNAAQQEKLKGSAASAAKSLVAAFTKGWEETFAPKIRETLPREYNEISNKALASAAVGLFVAAALLPSLFSSGGQKPTQLTQKKLDSETTALEKKLQRNKGVTSAYSSRSRSQKDVFPPEEKLGTVMPSPKNKPAPTEMKTERPASKVSESAKPSPSPQAPPTLPPTSLSSTRPSEAVKQTPAEQAETTAARPITPSTAPAKPVEPTKPKDTQPPKPVEVTPAIVMTAVTKALGSNATLVSSASFDTLSPQPTIVLEVSKAYHNMPAIEQKRLAQLMLQSARGLGYERVSLLEVGTGVEVAHAGLDVELEDEAENLRAQVGSLQKLSDKLATQNATKEAELDALNTRLSEEREEFAMQKGELEKTIKVLRAETSGLLEDLADAKAELAKMPDRMALEERTLEAERKSEKLSDTVEMLSIQLSKARSEEALAKKSEAKSIDDAKQAIKEKEEALASVATKIDDAKKAAETRANDRIATVEQDAQTSVEDANRRGREVEQRLARTLEESKASAEETKRSFEKQLNDQQEKNDREVQTIQSKYEAMLEEVQRRAQADLDAFQKEADRKMASAMKEAKAFANSLTKERDDALKEVQKVEKQAQKASDKAEREKQGLQKRIEKLQAKLNKKVAVQEEQQTAVESPSSG